MYGETIREIEKKLESFSEHLNADTAMIQISSKTFEIPMPVFKLIENLTAQLVEAKK